MADVGLNLRSDISPATLANFTPTLFRSVILGTSSSSVVGPAVVDGMEPLVGSL